MKTSDKIGHSHLEAMKKILDFIDSFNIHKLLYAISEKGLDEDAILSITFDLRDYNVKLLRQKVYLFDYTKTCNKKYALDDNKMVDSSARLTHRMRSGISGIKKTVKAFCKKSRQRLRPGQKEPQAIDRSLIATEEYMGDLFGLESYPDCVKELFREMIEFFNNMNSCLEEARRSLSEEKEIRGDKQRCLDLLFADRSIAYRSIIINGLSKLIYFIEGDIIYIADFWDVRRDPTLQAERVKKINKPNPRRGNTAVGICFSLLLSFNSLS